MNKIAIRELLCFGAGGAFGLHGAEGNWFGLIGALLIFPWLYLRSRSQMPEHEYGIQQLVSDNHAAMICTAIQTPENATNLLNSLEHRNSKASYRLVKREVGEWQPAPRTKTGPGRPHLRVV